jgi:hypothetical protein
LPALLFATIAEDSLAIAAASEIMQGKCDRVRNQTMCNVYNIKGTTKEISEHFRAVVPNLFNVQTDDILPGSLAPGLILNRDGERELVPM